MLSDAQVIERAAQPYVAIKSQVTMQTLGMVLPELTARVFGWLGERGISPAGAPFWKYNVVGSSRWPAWRDRFAAEVGEGAQSDLGCQASAGRGAMGRPPGDLRDRPRH